MICPCAITHNALHKTHICIQLVSCIETSKNEVNEKSPKRAEKHKMTFRLTFLAQPPGTAKTSPKRGCYITLLLCNLLF